MDLLRKIIMLTVLLGTMADGDFENATDLCQRCGCQIADQINTILSYDVLDCSRRNLHSMIATWPEEFRTGSAERAVVFSLSGNNITTLQQLPATKMSLVFSCRHCKLDNLNGGLFLDTPNVLRVDLSWNNLTEDAIRSDVFRGDFEHYKQLVLDDLDLGYNKITHLLDDAFQYIVSLRYLSLAHNPLGKITDSTTNALAPLVHIEHLDLSYTGLTELDETVFAAMYSLHELNLQGNFFTTIPEAVFRAVSLNILHLSENPIEVLNIKHPFEQLEHLNISSMPLLHSIEFESFQNVKQLKSFTGRNNTALDVFDLSVLKHVSHLQELDLSKSNLKHLGTPPQDDQRDHYFEHHYANMLESLLLEDNPWHCDCDLQRILMMVNYDYLEDPEEETRCETPYMLTSLHLSDLIHIDVCEQPVNDVPNNSVYEKPAFLRPGAILLTLLSVAVVVGLGIIIGLVIVCLKRRLKANGLGFTSPVRYTSVRESTTSAMYQP